MPLLNTGSSSTTRAHLMLLLLSTRVPLKSRSSPTEQSDLLSQFPGAATRAERICHDETWGPLSPHQTSNTCPVSGSFVLQWGTPLLSFPHFHPEGAVAAPVQAERLWKSRARSSQDWEAVAQGGVVDGGLWKQWPTFHSNKGKKLSVLPRSGMMLPPPCLPLRPAWAAPPATPVPPHLWHTGVLGQPRDKAARGV